MPTTTRRARPMPAQERRAALIDATVPLLREHGENISTRQIAEASGVAEGTIFRVFPDKDSLVRAAIEQAFDQADTIRRLAMIDKSQPLKERLTQAVVLLQDRFSQVFNLVGALGLSRPPGVTRGKHQHNAELLDELDALIAPDADQLQVKPAQLAKLLRMLAFSGTHPGISEGMPLTAAEIVDVLLDGVLKNRTN